MKKTNSRNNLNIPQNQSKWEREEVVLLVVEYFRTRYLPGEERMRSIELISKVLRKRAEIQRKDISPIYRNINGIKMQFACIQSLDQEKIELGHVGLNASTLQRQITEEYLKDPEKIQAEAYLVLNRYGVD